MAVSFSVANGGFIQSITTRLEFAVDGYIENPNLTSTVAPVYTSSGMSIRTATLNIASGVAGSIKVEIRSANTDGTGEVTHTSNTITTVSGAQSQSLTISTAAIGANKIVRLYLQYISGSINADMSVTLEGA